MKGAITLLVLMLHVAAAMGQSYNDSIVEYRKHYKEELLAEKNGPLKHAQAGNISFFAPDKAYRVWAALTETPASAPFQMPTHSGKLKPYREYGVLRFKLQDSMLTLHVYQSIDLMKQAAYKDHLFIPFNDMTNYELTYGGGRYIDLSIQDLKDGGLWLDFNKCYNPYCAYADGYSCPIPPNENRLHVEVRAGEKSFTR